MATFRFSQRNPPNLTAFHDVPQKVISPLSMLGFYQEIDQTGSIAEYLFQMDKDGVTYWIGAAVPQGTGDFSKVQVYFHPTVVNGGNVHAADADYRAFRGGWSGSIQRYVAMQGAQLAGARRTPLIVPFMTMAAQHGGAGAYMFAVDPLGTMNAIMSAVAAEVTGSPAQVNVSQIGVSSFSSGIGAMRLFIGSLGSTGRIVETTDFDGPFIIAERGRVTRSPGAITRIFSQVPPPLFEPGWVTMPAANFRNVQKYKDQGVHAQIGWMTYYMASLGSVIV